MPYLEEEAHQNLLAHQENNIELTKDFNHVKEQKRKLTIISIILGCLFLLALIFFIVFKFKYAKNYVKVEDTQQVIDTDSLQNYKIEISNLQHELEEHKTQNAEQASLVDKTIYAVQIGAFKKSDMSLYSSNFVNFKQISDRSYNKYALGNFETLPEAQAFRKAIVKLGFRDAFIASYKNDKRLKIEATD
ncbi:MAG: SPOR domain-containing protein [Winogradskyella sp.]